MELGVGRDSKGIRGQRRDVIGPRSRILAKAGLKVRLPAFPATSEVLLGHCHVYPLATEAKVMGMKVSSRLHCVEGGDPFFYYAWRMESGLLSLLELRALLGSKLSATRFQQSTSSRCPLLGLRGQGRGRSG